jgi:site-specific recombinase XerD
MKSNQSLGILFFIRKERGSGSKNAAIYLRITVNGKRAELSIKREIEIDRWNSKAGRAKGTKEEIRQLNEYINTWERRTYHYYKELLDNNQIISSDSIKNLLLGRNEKQKSLVEVFEYHNKLFAQTVNIDHAEGTLKRYEATLMHVKEFLHSEYKKEDIWLKELNYTFAADLEHYFITVRKCNRNTTSKYIKNLKKIVLLAIKNGWLEKDPFFSFKTPVKPVERYFLTMEELKKLEEKAFTISRLEVVRDIFVFSCYTGLAYIDVAKLTKDHISKGFDGKLWINTYRQKTETPSNIPLLSKAEEIVEKYKNHPVVCQKNTLLPVMSNQRFNAYLKEIADLCGIKKNLTFHIARHTFATTITLTNGVPIESVSSMLGHTSIKTTQIYAKVIKSKVSEDMRMLEEKLTQRLNNNDVRVVKV